MVFISKADKRNTSNGMTPNKSIRRPVRKVMKSGKGK